MTVHRIRTCACGHPVDWHEGSTGRCLYGRDHVMGGCTCEGFTKRRRSNVAAAPSTPIVSAIDDVIRALTELRRACVASSPSAPYLAPPAEGVSLRAAPPSSDRRAAARSAVPTEVRRLSEAERKILIVLAQRSEGASKVQIAILTVYSHKSGGFRNSLSSLRTSGFIVGDGDRMRITDEGLRRLGSFAELPTGPALLDYWKAHAGGRCERLILSSLAEIHPRFASKVELAALAGYRAASGGYRNALSRLRTLELVAGRGEISLSPTLAEAVGSRG